MPQNVWATGANGKRGAGDGHDVRHPPVTA
jgi:hypothetical protein